jgi:hypothetical protein
MNMIDRKVRASPPTPAPRKDSPINAEYEEHAKRVIREAMAKKGVTIEQLTERLASIGVDMSKGGVANKISRGGFSAAFFLQCMEALDIDLRVIPR